MTKEDFKGEMRLNRGRLSAKSIEDNMDYIFDNGSAKFVGYMLATKKLGIDKAAKIVSELTVTEQTELVEWVERQAASLPVASIELKVIRIQGDR